MFKTSPVWNPFFHAVQTKGEQIMAIIKRYHKKNGKKKTFYQAQVYVRGVRLNYKSFSTKEEAVMWHKAQRKKLIQNHSVFFESKKLKIDFSDCLKKYSKEGLPLLKKSSQETYKGRFKYFIKGPLSHIKMKDFKAHTIYKWIEWLKKQKTAQNKERKTFHKELKVLMTILYWYHNFVDESFNVPITKQHRQLCYYKCVPPRQPDYYAKPEELRDFVKWLKENKSNPVYWRLALFMILTGARVSEACGLSWDALDLNRGIARVIRRMAWEQRNKKPYLEETTKTASSARILLLPDELLEILKAMKKETQNRNDLIFVNHKNEALKYNAIQASFNAGFVALKLPWRSTHILRHSYATVALMATNSISAVQASLGHTSSQMTERYAKVVALLDREVAEKTAKVFDIFGNQNKTSK